MRVVVFGNSGSGKSTYATALARRNTLAHLDLDTLVWEQGRVAVARPAQAIAADLNTFIAGHQRWVIEGCYGEWVEAAASHCDRLVFLNPGVAACLANNLRRPWESHKYESPQAQQAMFETLQAWVADYEKRDDPWSYRQHRQLFDAFGGDKIEHTGAPPLN